jgi:hypothetical protein
MQAQATNAIGASALMSVFSFRKMRKQTQPREKLKWTTIFMMSVTSCVIAGSWLTMIKKNKEPVTLKKLFELEQIIQKNVMVGLVQGVVFGFIDNGAMYLGLDAIEQLLPKHNAMVRAGYGNMYSSIFGSIMGACLSKAVKKSTEIHDSPWWADTIGIIAGSFVGIHLPRYFLKDPEIETVEIKKLELTVNK